MPPAAVKRHGEIGIAPSRDTRRPARPRRRAGPGSRRKCRVSPRSAAAKTRPQRSRTAAAVSRKSAAPAGSRRESTARPGVRHSGRGLACRAARRGSARPSGRKYPAAFFAAISTCASSGTSPSGIATCSTISIPCARSASCFMFDIDTQRSMRADAEPVEHVRHQLLEAHVLHAGDAFGAVEIGVGAVAAALPLARVVDQEFGDLAEGAALLAVVDDDADPALLRGLRRRPRPRAPDRAGRCRCRSRTRPSRCTRRGRGRRSPCRARRCARHRRTDRPSCRRSAAGTLRGRAGSPAPGTCRRSPRTGCGAVRPRRRRTARRCRAGTTPGRSPPWSPGSRRSSSTTSPSGTMPPAAMRWRISGRLICARVTAIVGRTSMPARICSANTSPTRCPYGSSETIFARVGPLRPGPDHRRRRGVGQVGPVIRRQRSGRDRERAVDRIGAAIGADRIAVPVLGRAGDDGAAQLRARLRPSAPGRRLRRRRRDGRSAGYAVGSCAARSLPGNTSAGCDTSQACRRRQAASVPGNPETG